MKNRVLLSGLLLLVAAGPALAQEDSRSKKPSNCSGTISLDGQTFTCEKDHHIWKVSNPGVLRDMEGRHAKVTFRRSAAAGEIFVTAAVLVQEHTVAHNPGDSAFRR